MKQAAVLLRQTKSTIAEIANQVGYENQSKFGAAFRDILKITPAEYRKQNASEQAFIFLNLNCNKKVVK